MSYKQQQNMTKKPALQNDIRSMINMKLNSDIKYYQNKESCD